MSNSIGSVGGYSQAMMMQGMGHMRPPPNPAKMADDLFSKIDTSGKGYIEKSDLASAIGKISSSGDTASVDDVFSSLDSDSDGKVTKQEMTDSLQSLADTLESQFQNLRMNQAREGMNGGMPPPPPPGADGAGLTKDELTSQLEKIGDSDSTRASSLANIIENFEAADSNSDGKVSFEEAMAYDKASGKDSTNTASSTDAQVMMTIMKLMNTYAAFGSESGQSTETSLISESA